MKKKKREKSEKKRKNPGFSKPKTKRFIVCLNEVQDNSVKFIFFFRKKNRLKRSLFSRNSPIETFGFIKKGFTR